MAAAELVTEPSGEPWDVVVVGTGMGGGAIGYRLATAGLRVLFVEKGRVASSALDPADADDPKARQDAGHWPERVALEVDGVRADGFLPLGSGVGGSTILYSASLERFERTDVEPVEELPHPTEGWPVPWAVWERYYALAEQLLDVRGGPAPAAVSPPPASALDQDFIALLRCNGLSPYRLHVGIGYRPGCRECGGLRCADGCKSDAATRFVTPALGSGHAALWVDSDVLRIEADADAVRGVTVRRGGAERLVPARAVVLAAGAYHSPAVLLRSANEHWPDGLANRSGMVGRCLMFHANEWLAVWPRARLSDAGPRKTIGLRDLYAVHGVRLGSVQSTGLSASFGNIYGFLRARLARSRWRRVPGAAFALKLASFLAVRLLGTATIFVMLVEDLGYPDNRVELDPDDPSRIRVTYRIAPELRARAARARLLLRRCFRGARALSLQGDVDLNLGHACGTCRFGTDPATSVLGPDCRAHGLANLYVVDGSFMPSSGGTNPGLTIAANALRVGDLLAGRLRGEGPGADLYRQASPSEMLAAVDSGVRSSG